MANERESGADGAPLAGVAYVAASVCSLSVPFASLLLFQGFVTASPAAQSLLASLQLFVAQDRWVGPLVAVLIVSAWWASRARLWRLPMPASRERVAVAALAGLAFLATLLLRHVAHHNFDLTLDEFMPAFQAEIFRNGDLLAPLPDEFLPPNQRLQPFFSYVDVEHGLWGSAYRPVHAALLALLPAAHSTAVMHGLLAALSVLAMGSIARRLFPRLEGAALIACLLLVGSPQFIATATSGFSFTAHLAFNLAWLALFLRGRWSTHCLAAVIGMLAVGLHQVHVHLLFVLPFGVAMILGAFGDRRMALPYLVSYAIALPLWMAWPEIATWLETGDASVLPRTLLEIEYVADYLQHSDRFAEVRGQVGPVLLLGDLLRFALWLSPALLPLILLVRARRLTLVPALCAAGVLLTVAVVYRLMPYQMQGWGARYYHPVLGNVVILGLAALAALPDDGSRRRMVRVTVLLALVGLTILLPLRLVQVSEKVGPRAKLQTAIEALDADAVAIRDEAWFPADQVRNDPYLRNLPLILLLPAGEAVQPGLGRVIVLDAPAIVALGRPSGTYLEP
jgi:hypothetical protein